VTCEHDTRANLEICRLPVLIEQKQATTN